MASEIQILSDRVANQIAAGEVIERPMAVVKELVENGIDAGANKIEVEFKDGGKSYIRVEDNGAGMSPEQALLSLERHATSKIRTADDLLAIRSFGFRGEAIPSIASVSRFLLRTRAQGFATGTEISVNGGRFVHQRDCGMSQGTCVIVEHLFNSVPARRKFLKTDNTEAAHIIHFVRLLALSQPGIAFRLIENGREVFRSPVCNSLRDRIAEIWSRDLAKDLIELPLSESEGMKLYGLIGKPGSTSATRATRSEMITLVNQRPVDNKTLVYAVLESYHGFIPRGRYPVMYLFLDVPSGSVDVNVHPAKREVRFREEGKVRRFVMESILNTLHTDMDSMTVASRLIEERAAKQPSLDESVTPREKDRKVEVEIVGSVNQDSQKQVLSPERKNPVIHSLPMPRLERLAKQSELPEEKKDEAVIQNHGWMFLSFLYGKFSLWESLQGLVVMNPVAAQERILYERLQNDFETGKTMSQPLLVPVPLELDAMAVTLLNTMLPLLETAGFTIENFGRNFFRIESVPEWLNKEDAGLFVRDLLALFLEKGFNPSKTGLAKEQLARLAAMKTSGSRSYQGDINSQKQLLQTLLQCRYPLICPRGRPTLIEYSRSEIERRLFG